MGRNARLFWLWAGGLALLYSVPSILFRGFANAGNFAIAALGALAFFTPALWARVGKGWRRALGAAWAAGLAAVTLLSCAMAVTAHVFTADAAAPPPRTVIVLGAKLRLDEPSLILERRLEAALSYLTRHPDAVVIVSGGLGEGETYTEAAVMRMWLTQRGIAPERIYEESAAVVTSENIEFSADIIRENGLDTNAAICTDGFHQLRSAIFARKEGLTPSALSSRTPIGLIPMYYAREWFALVKALVVGS